MAGTVTVTQTPLKTLQGREINKVQVDWISDASGNATGAITLWGNLIKVNTTPGSPAPTSYGITLVDPDGAVADALTGLLASRSATVGEVKYMTATGNSLPIYLTGTYTFTVASAGNAKAGSAWFYLLDDL